MATGAGKDGNKYEWQSWPPDSLEGMPPKRRRLAGWALFWFILLGSVVGYGLEGLGVAEPWRSLLVAAVMAAIFVPLIRAAVLEARQLRAEGADLPSIQVTRKVLIVTGALAAVTWIVYAVGAINGEPGSLVLPIACTVWLVFLVRRWRTGP
ncbi:hypothetical protein [Arthrobacter sp. NPDC093139]|uniref:hypothetical protein n=1 Tax=Arthrobacter sp. NPDC093139 TaxID=3363945 RepID=UPI0037FAB9A1